MIALIAFALAASCAPERRVGPTEVSVIGARMRMPDPNRVALTAPDAVLAQATGEGLVRFDANGQVEPGLAESWIVTGDGLSTIFRIRQTKWPNGRDITGDDVAASLNAAIGANSRNPHKPLLTAIDSVVGMTGRVVEIRLRVPRPNLLELIAQPELAIRRGAASVGPFRIASVTPTRVELTPASLDDEAPTVDPVVLRADRAALAIARFNAGDSDLVLGGGLADLPLLGATRVASGRLRFDPARGLFGLAVVSRSPFLKSREVREALAMAIDRAALPQAVGAPNWAVADTVLPARLDSSAPPFRPAWASVTPAQRRADAAERVTRARGEGPAPVVQLALPAGPGMRRLAAALIRDWRQIGIGVVVVPMSSRDADLRLIDEVAPVSSANWYLTRLSCAAGLVCDAVGDDRLFASRAALSLAERSVQLAEADRALGERASFMPLGTPLRWSLVAPGLTGWRENVFAVHPLAELRGAR